MTKVVRIILLFCILFGISRTLMAQKDCSPTQDVVAEARIYYEQGFYPESLRLLSQLEKNLISKKGNSCLSREFYELKVKLLLAANETDGLIDSVMKDMIVKDPTFDDINIGSYSQAFFNRFNTFNVYPNVQVGIGTTISRISIKSNGEFSPVYESGKATDLSLNSPGSFTVSGLTVFSTVYFHNNFAGKLELTQNLPAVSKLSYNLDPINHISIKENIYSRSYTFSLISNFGLINKSKVNLIDDLWLGVGYKIFDLYQSSSRYEFSTGSNEEGTSIRYIDEIDTKPFRKNIVHNLVFGLFYEPKQIINNRRIKLITGLSYVLGLSDYNRTEKRFDNLVGTQLYYYAEDRFRMESVQFQLQVGYNVHYYKNKRK